MRNPLEEIERRIHEANTEAWQAGRKVKELERKIALMEKYFGIKLVKTKEHYQKMED